MIWVGTTCEAARIILDLKVTIPSTLLPLGTGSLYTGFNAATRLPEFLLHLRMVFNLPQSSAHPLESQKFYWRCLSNLSEKGEEDLTPSTSLIRIVYVHITKRQEIQMLGRQKKSNTLRVHY